MAKPWSLDENYTFPSKKAAEEFFKRMRLRDPRDPRDPNTPKYKRAIYPEDHESLVRKAFRTLTVDHCTRVRASWFADAPTVECSIKIRLCTGLVTLKECHAHHVVQESGITLEDIELRPRRLVNFDGQHLNDTALAEKFTAWHERVAVLMPSCKSCNSSKGRRL